VYNHIGFYLAANVAQPLAAEFGDRLEDMTKNDKLLLIHILSGGLSELERFPNIEEYSFLEYVQDSEMGSDCLTPVMPLLRQFDEYDSKTIETILVVLAMSLQQ